MDAGVGASSVLSSASKTSRSDAAAKTVSSRGAGAACSAPPVSVPFLHPKPASKATARTIRNRMRSL